VGVLVIGRRGSDNMPTFHKFDRDGVLSHVTILGDTRAALDSRKNDFPTSMETSCPMSLGLSGSQRYPAVQARGYGVFVDRQSCVMWQAAEV
jgi:hypothetical protein